MKEKFIVDTDIETYIENHTSEESELLYQLNRKTHIEFSRTQMLSGKVQGRVLSMISFMVKPKFILELGTYTGYSAICLAEGLAEGGKVITIDNNAEYSEKALKLFKENGLDDRIDIKIGNALEILPELKVKFDLAFIDADKQNYLSYYEFLVTNMQPGSFIVVDNVLWKGLVTDEEANDKLSVALKEFNKHIQQDDRVENVILSVRDGLSLIRIK